MTLPLGCCLSCGVKLKNFGEAYPGAHSKGRKLVPLRLRRNWCRMCWMKYAWYKCRGYTDLGRLTGTHLPSARVGLKVSL